MSKKSLSLEVAREMYNNWCNSPETFPVSFCYDGVAHHGLGGLPLLDKQENDTRFGHQVINTFALDDIILRTECSFCAEYGEFEYTVWFENPSDKPSKVISKWLSLDVDMTAAQPVLRGCLGDLQNFYRPYEHDLTKGTQYFRSVGGRATHINFPYFDVVNGDGGFMVALGWAGTWNALFAPHGDKLTIQLATCNDFEAFLLPGEKVRSGLVAVLPYRGRGRQDAANLWREWYQRYNMPRANVQGDYIKPFSTSCFAGDTGKPNSDGSISEDYGTWKRTLDKIKAENLVPDFRWFDAGWYASPAGETVPVWWWANVGSWIADPVKWPGDTLLESNEACHQAGMKCLVWFEPERVTHVDDLAKYHDYKPEWAIPNGEVITSNIGIPECREWTLKRITTMMKKNGFDLYREDNNSDPAFSWGKLDKDISVSMGMPRNGVAENLCIQAHYRLWDDIIDFCGKNGKCTFVDSCASGGGRNDLESMRRGIPFLRSDFDRTSTALRLSMTASVNQWLPFHGASTKETAGQLDVSAGRCESVYTNRASLLPVYNFYYAYATNPEIDFEAVRRNFQEWKSVRKYLTKDQYVLTPWHHEYDRMGWAVFAYHDTDDDTALILAFRQEDCAEESFQARLAFLTGDRKYQVTDDDSGKSFATSGEELKNGFAIVLPQKKSSALLRIKPL